MQKISSGNIVKGVLIGLSGLIVLILVFNLGLLVGYRKAIFSERWGENYQRNFIGPRPLPAGFHIGDFLNADSTAGLVLSVTGSTIVIKDNQNTERTIIVSTSTTIREGDETVTLADLKPNDHIAVIGQPDNTGELQANFIRAFDSSSTPLNPDSDGN
jgi:hypothetical protein